MDRSSTVLTIGLVLDHAQVHQVPVDVSTTDGRTFARVAVAALDRFCIVLLEDDGPGSRAHVVSREHVVSVSMSRDDLLAIETTTGQGSRTA
jgi:hypothetical protein